MQELQELEKLLERFLNSLIIFGIIILIGIIIAGITGNDNILMYSVIIALKLEEILLPTFAVIYLVKNYYLGEENEKRMFKM